MKPQHQTVTPMDLFRQQVSSLPKMGNSSLTKPEAKRAQMTIFYGGEVIVLDDCSAERAKEIMSFASREINQSQNNNNNNNNNYAYTFTQTHPSLAFGMNVIPDSGNNLVQEQLPQAPPRPVVCDFPLTRKASLYRFLEKRKDRITARAPYHTGNPITATSKPAESMAWLALSPHSPQDRSESCSNFV